MKRLALALCLLAFPAQAQMMQRDVNDTPVQDFFRLGSAKTLTINATSQMIGALNDTTRLVLITCTVACNVAQRSSPATASATNSFLLPANTILRVRVNRGDGFAFIGTTGAAWVVELQ